MFWAAMAGDDDHIGTVAAGPLGNGGCGCPREHTMRFMLFAQTRKPLIGNLKQRCAVGDISAAQPRRELHHK